MTTMDYLTTTVMAPDPNVSISLASVTMTTTLPGNVTNATMSNCSSESSTLLDDIDAVERYISPIVYAIGFPGNVLSLLIWIQPRMSHSSGVYLAALALVDFIFLLLHMSYKLHEVWGHKFLDNPVLCESFTIIYLAFQYLAPLLVLGFTVERYISICHPFKREKYCTIRRAKLVTISLAVLSVAICAIQGYFWTITPDGTCGIRQEEIEAGTRSFWNIWSWVTELLMFLVVPLCVLLFNMLVIREANRMSRYEQNQLQGQGHSQKTSATTIMLLAVSFYLIFTTLPVTIVYASVLNFEEGDMCASQETDPIWRRYYIYILVRRVIEEIGITHFALNFYIYMITGKMFRKEFKKLFLNVIGKRLPERVRTEYSTLRGSFRSNSKVNTVVRVSNGATTKEDGTETNV